MKGASTLTGTREKIAWTSFWGNLILAALKISAGVISFSRLLFIDGVFSALCSVLVVIMLAGLGASETEADHIHKHGHGKAEFIYSAVTGMFIIATGIFLLLISTENFMEEYTGSAGVTGALVAFISLITNFMLYRYISGKSEEFHSRVLADNASVVFFGIFTSSLVLLGIAASAGNFFVMEQTAACLISCIILLTGIRIFRRGIDGIMDRESFSHTPFRVHAIRRAAGAVDAVRSVGDIKIRRMGDKDMINLEILIDEKTSVGRAHEIAEGIKKRIMENLSYAGVVYVNYRAVGN